jgi:hypothetical protein
VVVGVVAGFLKKKSLLLAKIKFEPIFFSQRDPFGTGSLAVFIQKGLIAGWTGQPRC